MKIGPVSSNQAPSLLNILLITCSCIIHKSILQTFATIRSLRVRQRPSLLPFIGSALSFLFGTVSESDLSSIRNNVKLLSQNQNKLFHVVK